MPKHGATPPQVNSASNTRGSASIVEISELDRVLSNSGLDGGHLYLRPLTSQVRNFGTSMQDKNELTATKLSNL